MLAGLLFATHDAVDRPDMLAATLPLGGSTLIEFQARLLVEAGAAQLIVAVSRLTPELLGAVNRMTRRGVTVDVVRNAVEAGQKLHPLSRIVMLADGLVATEATLAMLAGEGDDALMVIDEANAPPAFERIGGGAAWAGIARLDPRRIEEAARLPRDYDLQSALVRVTSQAGAAYIVLPVEALADGHGIEHRAGGVAARGRTMLAALVARRPAWFDRYLVGPVARRVLPMLVDRGVAAGAAAAAAGVTGVIALALLVYGYPAAGLALVVLASMGVSLAATLARLHDAAGMARGTDIGAGVLAGVAMLLLGRGVDDAAAGTTGVVTALALIVAGVLADRAALPTMRRRWWASMPAYPLVALPLTLFGLPLAGLGLAAVYAATTLAAVVETLRRQP